MQRNKKANSDMPKEIKIQDIPSFRKAKSDIRNLKALKSAMRLLGPAIRFAGVDTEQIDKTLKETDRFEELAEDLTTVPDRFNNHFAGLGLIYYEDMNLDAAKVAIEIADSGNLEGAEAYLVEYYNPDMVQWMLSRMESIEEFRRRMPLAQKALIDYREERYHACVPVVIALADGMVTELYYKITGKKRGLSAEDIHLEAWDSVSAHSRGLGQLVPLLMKGRYQTRTEQISNPYRHGIMHGMDLGYDNKEVAVKSWAFLFTLRDWAIKAEKGSVGPPSPEKKPSLMDQLRRNQKNRRLLQEWKPREIKPSQNIPVSGKPADYEMGSPERLLAEFLEYWRLQNFYFMAKRCFKLGFKSTANPRDLKSAYSKRKLNAFEFEEVRDQAAAVTVITTKLIYEESGCEIKGSFEFRLQNFDSNWEVQVRGYSNSSWFILNWDWL
jgi:hypothetical protein